MGLPLDLMKLLWQLLRVCKMSKNKLQESVSDNNNNLFMSADLSILKIHMEQVIYDIFFINSMMTTQPVPCLVESTTFLSALWM